MGARQGKADTSLSRDNTRSRWHTEGDDSEHSSWACVPLTDAVEAVFDEGAEVERLRELLEEAATAMEQAGDSLNSTLLDRAAARIRKALKR